MSEVIHNYPNYFFESICFLSHFNIILSQPHRSLSWQPYKFHCRYVHLPQIFPRLVLCLFEKKLAAILLKAHGVDRVVKKFRPHSFPIIFVHISTFRLNCGSSQRDMTAYHKNQNKIVKNPHFHNCFQNHLL